MATTHAPSEAITYVNYMIKNLRISDVQYEILDEASSLIWHAAPWSWTISALTTLTLANGTVDYTITTSAHEYLYKATLVSSADGANAIYKPLKIEPLLPSSPILVGEVNSVSMPDGASNTIRVWPQPTAALGKAQKILLYGKKTYSKISSANAATVGSHNLDDRWWHVFKQAVLVTAYQYADDDRGLGIEYDPQKRAAVMKGSMAYLYFLLDEMRRKEPMPCEWETYAENAADHR